MMFTISPLLALVALVTVPHLALRDQARSRSGPSRRFIAQWRHTGPLNAQVEEAFTGHAIVKAFGRQHEVEERFKAKNEELYDASFGAQFIVGHHPAGDDVRRQPQLRRHRRRRRAASRPAALIASATSRRSSSTRGSSRSRSRSSRRWPNVLQSGIASLERVFELLDAPEQIARRRASLAGRPIRRAASSSSTSRSRTTRTSR